MYPLEITPQRKQLCAWGSLNLTQSKKMKTTVRQVSTLRSIAQQTLSVTENKNCEDITQHEKLYMQQP